MIHLKLEVPVSRHDTPLPLALVLLPLGGVVLAEDERSKADPLIADVGPRVDGAGFPGERAIAVPLSGLEISSV